MTLNKSSIPKIKKTLELSKVDPVPVADIHPLQSNKLLIKHKPKKDDSPKNISKGKILRIPHLHLAPSSQLPLIAGG
jgi:hypothetical protein